MKSCVIGFDETEGEVYALKYIKWEHVAPNYIQWEHVAPNYNFSHILQ
jgi:hypothetical protein